MAFFVSTKLSLLLRHVYLYDSLPKLLYDSESVIS